jgi:chitin synthase
LLGIFQNGLMVGKFQGKDVHAHIFEYTTQVCLDPLVDPASSAGSLETPVQMLFCIKEKNEGREESHRWFSPAIFPALQPQMFMFIPPGLHPRRDAIYRMLREIDSHQSCGEAIGQITPNVSSLDWLRYPLAAVSALEQKLIYTFDKPIESGLGSAVALPTTFSAFRHLLPQQMKNYSKGSSFCDDKKPVDDPYAILSMPRDDTVCYLSENRQWAMKFLAQYQLGWSLVYVPKVKADIPLRMINDRSSPTLDIHIPTSISEYSEAQRRSFQNTVTFFRHCVSHFRQLKTVKYQYFRKLGLVILLIHYSFEFLISWFAIVRALTSFGFLWGFQIRSADI